MPITPANALDTASVHQFLAEHYGLAGVVEQLPGELDSNLRVTTPNGERYVLRVHHPNADAAEIDLQAAVLRHLECVAVGPLLRGMVQRVVPALTGELLPLFTTASGEQRIIRLTSWLDGEVWATAVAKGAARRRSAASLGRLLAGLDHHLRSFSHPAARRAHRWDLARAAEQLQYVDRIQDAHKRATVTAVLERFREVVAPLLVDQPRQLIHNDANDHNVLLSEDGTVSGLIDFGDTVESWRINELAIACAYAMIGADDPVGAVVPLVAGYHDDNPLTETEAEVLFDLVQARYAVSICLATTQIADDPTNTYLLISQADVWDRLQRLRAENARIAVMRFRAACRFEAVPDRVYVERWLTANGHRFQPVLQRDLGPQALTVLDLTAPGTGLDALYDDVALATTVAVGRFGEDRSVYRSAAFETADPDERRTIHVGIDLFAPAETAVVAPFAGMVHEIGCDLVPLGFGGILVLQHATSDGTPFWTLFGHLASTSLDHLQPGQPVEAGAVVARLGRPDENGNWPPHLHFQVMTDLCGWTASEIVGVVARSQWDVWRSVFLDPNLVLGLAVDCSVIVERDPAWLQRERRSVLGRSLSLAYADPLKIVRGEGIHLIDERGDRYLDMVNNVCHVGHCHPRVVAAGQRQMAVLNTNSRYLHDHLVEYSRRLSATMPLSGPHGRSPSELSVVFMVNSGSEANDLALRLARAYTANHDVITVDHAYHGNVTAIVEVSPYKFAGPGGGGKAEHVWVAEMPDLYRGRFRSRDSGGDREGAGHDHTDAGTAYAASVGEQVEAMRAIGRGPAAFFSEGILGTGGMLALPDGYLAAAYAHVRAAGGLCIADEVQVGFGRVGSHMWAFETQGVVPDIVTMGKPIGNGHPMAAVITRPEIAAAFANGMEYFSTFGGNPVSAAIGLAVLDVIRDERLVHNAAVVGEQMVLGLRRLAERHDIIGDVRGHGLFLGVELVRDRSTLEPADRELWRVVEAMKARRILLSTEGPLHNVLKIKPPLVLSPDNCEEFLGALDEVLAAL